VIAGRQPARLAALIALALLACGGDDAGAIDAGAPLDARRFADAAAIACAIDAGCPAGRQPVCDLERGACVECTGDADCAAPGALGPRCDEAPGYCTCAGDDDCAGSASGPRCDGAVKACTCRLDAECPDGSTCELDPYLGVGLRTCVASGG
jgi:hypothetical protein